jgi:hypothetical protein
MQAYASQNGATFWNSRLFLEKIRRARVAGGSERGDGHVGHEQSGDTAGCRVQRRRGAAGHEQRWAEASRGMRNAACNACALCETKGREQWVGDEWVDGWTDECRRRRYRGGNGSKAKCNGDNEGEGAGVGWRWRLREHGQLPHLGACWLVGEWAERAWVVVAGLGGC